ncbi:MAG: hypothetical protein ACAI35_03580 [Candidatus Methylacidiphilales bacterium]
MITSTLSHGAIDFSYTEPVLTTLVQTALQNQNLYAGAIDGIWGPITRRGFQQYAAASANPPPADDKAEDHQEPWLTELVQIALSHTAAPALAHYEGAIDGLCGPLTRAAFTAYATAHDDIVAQIGVSGLNLILYFEVGGGEAYYTRHLAEPTWPGVSSGVTIGIGYDLGYNTEAQIRADWASRIARVEPLMPASGVTGSRAQSIVGSIRKTLGAPIPWHAAYEVFRRRTLPRFIALTRSALPGFDQVPADARGALVSLVFNRGAGMQETDSRREMRAIRDLLRTASISDKRQIPAQIYSMKRLWPNTLGLLRRRDAEADLFESSIAETGQTNV